MPELARPDGARLHWESRGDGPLVVCAFACISCPRVFDALLDGLAVDHRVVAYDPRGFGRSSREGPYDPETDVEDLIALLERLGGPALALATGDGLLRAVRVAVRRPDLVHAVVSPGGNPLGRGPLAGTDALAASDSVIAVLLETMRVDYRAGLRMAIGPANPQLDEEGIRERLAQQESYASHAAAVARLSAWVADGTVEEARALGGRLWLLDPPDNPWFPPEVARAAARLLPDANVRAVEGGPLSRPDITLEVVRQLTAPRRAAAAGRAQTR